MAYFAHSGRPDDRSGWQSLPDHLNATAALAASFAAPFGLDRLAFLTALLHDLGKYDPRFQQRLDGAAIGVDHSTAGAAILCDLARGLDAGSRLMAELGAYAILGHHAGLPDRKSAERSSFDHRIETFVDRLDPDWKAEIVPDLAGLAPDWLPKLVASPYLGFDLSVVARVLFSCLVDADFKDTEAFYARLEQREVDREWPALQEVLPQLRAGFDAHIAGLPREGALNALRRDILSHVRAGATLPPGLFTLTVPTGGGKTLASLGFALDHAALHGHRRIIYAIPFTSIIDQTADIFRRVLGADCVLEHHSAIEDDEAARRDRSEPPTSRDRLKLAMEDWAAPVVVTTNVQFFESLFAARTSRARKLHNIAGSIVILDEAQTIPRALLKPCVRMIDALACLFGCTIVLCTATQPALGRKRPDGAPGFPDGLDLDASRELAPDPEGLARSLRRTRIHAGKVMDNDALVAALAAEPQALVIVNSRKHALALYTQAKDAGLDGLVHLTTRQCAAHRREILDDVRERLKAGQPCRVVATSLIEAGVDVDFPRVWRAEAGWDQIMQAAGRCNREGRRPADESVVTVFSAPDYPPPPEIRLLTGDAERAFRTYDGDLQSLEAIRKFFGEVYWRVDERLDGRERKKAILPRLDVTHEGTNFAFRSIAQDFRMIESNMVPVIVRLDSKSRQAVDKLKVEKIPSGTIAQELQTYVVQVPPKARDLLIRSGHVAFECVALRADQFAVLQKQSLYDPEVGLLWETPEYLALEDMFM